MENSLRDRHGPSRLIRAALAACLASGLIFAQSGTLADQTNRPLDRVVAAYYPPLMIDAEADAPGLAVEILRIAANRLDRDLAIEFLPFPRALQAMQNRSDTLMPALFRNDTREDEFLWIAQIDATKVRFLSLDRRVGSLEQARALDKIGVEADSTGDTVLTGMGFQNLERLAGPEMSARMLDAGRIDAWVLTRPLAETVWQRMGLKRQLIPGVILFEVPIYMVAGLGFPEEDALSYRRTIAGMHGDGTVTYLLDKYEIQH